MNRRRSVELDATRGGTSQEPASISFSISGPTHQAHEGVEGCSYVGRKVESFRFRPVYLPETNVSRSTYYVLQICTVF